MNKFPRTGTVIWTNHDQTQRLCRVTGFKGSFSNTWQETDYVIVEQRSYDGVGKETWIEINDIGVWQTAVSQYVRAVVPVPVSERQESRKG